jgi:hypothetical protein
MEPIVKMWKFYFIFILFLKNLVIHEIPLHVSKPYFSGQKSENWPPKKIVVLTSHHSITQNNYWSMQTGLGSNSPMMNLWPSIEGKSNLRVRV